MQVQSYHQNLSFKTKFLNFFRKFFIISKSDVLLAAYTRKRNGMTLASKLIPPNYLYLPNSIRKCTLNGINFETDLSDKNGHANYYGINDPILRKALTLIREGMVIYDIGTNIGTFSLHFSQKAGPRGTVISFEPSPYIFEKACKNFSLNPSSNIRIFNQGVGDQKSEVPLYRVNNHNLGMSRIISGQFENEFVTEKIQIDTLDNLIVSLKLPPPDLIKIDVEGYENNVLKGAQNTISTYMPLLIIELDDNYLREQTSSAIELVSNLKGMGYLVRNALQNKELSPKADLTGCHFDILCEPK